MRSIALLAALATLSPIAAADIVFSDTEFVTSNWGVESVSIGGGGSTVVSQVQSGGNPGAFRRVDVTLAPSIGDAIYTLHRYGTTTATRYDPATQGAVVSLDFRIDYRDVPGAGATAHQKVYFGAKQGTVMFAGPGLQQAASASFGTWSISGINAADFAPVGSPGSLDLSATGAPIRFGFITYAENTIGALSSRSEYDNFSVTIHQVPAPGSAAIAALAFGRRRRR